MNRVNNAKMHIGFALKELKSFYSEPRNQSNEALDTIHLLERAQRHAAKITPPVMTTGLMGSPNWTGD